MLGLGGPKQRALLALLLVHANMVVSRDQLIDGLWGERAPESANHTLEDYVSRLRKILGSDRIATRTPGYLLHVARDEFDLWRFQRLADEGERALACDRPSEAVERFDDALALWRGAPLADVVYAPFASREAERLEDIRISVLERRLESELAAGRSSTLVGELEQLARTHPLRERLVYLLMLALYRSGRQSTALAAFREARRRLVDELGVEPGPELQMLHRQILEHDARLSQPPPRPEIAETRSRRRPVSYAVVCVVLLAAVATATALNATRGTRHASSPERIRTSQVVALLATSGRLMGRTNLVSAPAAATTGDGIAVWLAEADSDAVTQIDTSSGNVVNRIAVPGGAAALAVGDGAVWALAAQRGTVVRIDRATARITQRIALGGARASALAFGHGSLWVADTADSALIEIVPEGGAIRRVEQLELRPTAVALGAKTIWVADYDANTVAEIDPRDGSTLTTIHVGNGPGAIALGLGAVWVANTLDSTVSRIAPARGVVVATTPVGSGPGALAVAAGSVWTADRYSGAVSRLDPSRDLVVAKTAVGGAPATITAAGGSLWIGLQPDKQQRGGTLRLLSSSPLSIDPAVQVNVTPAQTGGLTTDGLVSYNHVGGTAGLQLVPDLAVALPTPTDGGRTYRFRLRPEIRYSDGRLVRASDFARAFARLFRFRPDNSDSFRGILGAAACIKAQAHCDLSHGLVADDVRRTVTFHLREADPNFLTTLTYGSLSAPVPPGTPLGSLGLRPIPGTGPYKVASASRGEIRYVRNPYFREWSHAAQPTGNPDRIEMHFGLSPEQEVRAIVSGRADWMVDSIPAQLLPGLQRLHAAQLHTYATPETDWLQLNTARAPFDDIRVRRALNLAIDRRIAMRTYGGRSFASPTCQVLPPGVSGYRRYCPYTRSPTASGVWTAPNLGRARELVAQSGTRDARITVSGWTDDCCLRPPLVEYVAKMLGRLGYRVRTRYVSHSSLVGAPAKVYEAIQVIPTGWTDPTADNFFSTWFSCSGAGDHGDFCDPGIDRRIAQAKALAATDPRAAAVRWTSIDHELVDRAALVPLFNERFIEFVSARVRNFQHNPNWGSSRTRCHFASTEAEPVIGRFSRAKGLLSQRRRFDSCTWVPETWAAVEPA